MRLSKLREALKKEGKNPNIDQLMETFEVRLPPPLDSNAPETPGTEPRDLNDPTSLGRFMLLGELGSGGMGRVLEGRDPDLRRSVAIKILIDPEGISKRQLARFVSEAQVTAQLVHPNIVPIYDMGVADDGQIYIVMQKVEGRSLGQVIRDMRKASEETELIANRYRLLNIFVQVCNALAFAHDRGVIHRDLKPANIMLGAFGEVLVLDWGLALVKNDVEAPRRPPDPGSGVPTPQPSIDRLTMEGTREGTLLGTPGYMSPEQIAGEHRNLDPRSDIWSLGAILYEILTFTRVYPSTSAEKIVYQMMSGPPEDPRARAPARDIPDEIAQVCMKALQPDKRARHDSALSLGAAVESFLEGSRRRRAALHHIEETRTAWEHYNDLEAERIALLDTARSLAEETPRWAPLSDKTLLTEAHLRIKTLVQERALTFSRIISQCDRALAMAPGNTDARGLLADAHLARLMEAEEAQLPGESLYHEARVKQHDDGRHTAILKGTGALTLRTAPPGTRVLCQRYDTSAALVWPLSEPQDLGVTPLEKIPLDMGSYRLTLVHPQFRDTIYPVFITRGRHWDSGPDPVKLLGEDEIEPGFVYVPPGPFLTETTGDDFAPYPQHELHAEGYLISIFPVTMESYCPFIRHAALEDPERAWNRVPRIESGFGGNGGQYWPRPDDGISYVIPEVDQDGDVWHLDFPVFGISWHDAMAYTAWYSELTGLHYDLPSSSQWEKAFRGIDGRTYPWGEDFDATLCKMRYSRQGPMQPEPVGAFPTDVSIYGVRDMAGNMREWCHAPSYAGATQKQVRGGSWHSSRSDCRATYRFGYEPWVVHTNLGFRLIRSL